MESLCTRTYEDPYLEELIQETQYDQEVQGRSYQVELVFVLDVRLC